ncbi:hypothetical protein NPIL_84211 [Nephila pilipes]|uniref:Uncharacterized protein n=1 Tax=Nephila pilipes TaxID=299642 RepID=A0A8X6PN50_NEPPI|nr:hypothetical protein NPIL_84211 [Nephila pilipes]
MSKTGIGSAALQLPVTVAALPIASLGSAAPAANRWCDRIWSTLGCSGLRRESDTGRSWSWMMQTIDFGELESTELIKCIVIFCATLAAAQASLIAPTALRTLVLAAVLLEIVAAAAPVGIIASGFIGNSIVANRIIGNGLILANRITAAPLAVRTRFLGAPVGLGIGKLGLGFGAPFGLGLAIKLFLKHSEVTLNVFHRKIIFLDAKAFYEFADSSVPDCSISESVHVLRPWAGSSLKDSLHVEARSNLAAESELQYHHTTDGRRESQGRANNQGGMDSDLAYFSSGVGELSSTIVMLCEGAYYPKSKYGTIRLIENQAYNSNR